MNSNVIHFNSKLSSTQMLHDTDVKNGNMFALDSKYIYLHTSNIYSMWRAITVSQGECKYMIYNGISSIVPAIVSVEMI